MGKQTNMTEPDEMSFLDHLEELRWHLVRAILAIVILAVVAFIFKNIVFDHIIIAPSRPDFFTNKVLCSFGKFIGIERLCINAEQLNLFNIKMSGQFSAHIMVSLIGGFIVAFPYVFWEIWQFLVPALYSNEKKYARGSVFFSSLLFMLGVLFGYYIIVPLSVHFLGSYQVSENVPNQINLVSYMSTVASIVLACGVIFELPILVFFLTKAGLVTPEFLRKYRRHSLVVILLLSAIITPPDIFSQILVAFPLIGLYELGITISRRIVRKQDEDEMTTDEEASDYEGNNDNDEEEID
jgi:sec-independent protein translocase protein TatC